MPTKTYSDHERQEKITQALRLRYQERKNWEEIAKDLDLARSTLSEWRKDDDFREEDSRWRRVLREQARGDSAQMLDEAIATLYELMKTDRSGYVRYMASTKLIDLNNVQHEQEEIAADQAKELNDFLLKEMKQRALKPVEFKTLPNGLLPDEIQAENERYRDRKRSELETITAEFRQVEKARESS